MLFSVAFFSIPLAVYWGDYLTFAFSIALIFAVANYTPSLVSHLIEIHQNNLEDIKEQELEEVEWKNYSYSYKCRLGEDWKKAIDYELK